MSYRDFYDVLAKIQNVVEYSDIDLKDVNQKGMFGNTPLSVVTTWGDLEAAILLLDAGAELNLKLELGYTVLHSAVSFGHTEMVKLYLDRGAKRDILNNDGNSPRHIAEFYKNSKIVDLLSNWH